MSESTVLVPGVEVPITPAEVLATAALQGAADADEMAAQEKRCARILNSITTTFKRGARLQAKSMLRVGMLCDAYLRGKMALNEKRAMAVKAIEGRLCEASGAEDVSVNSLIATYHAWRLLAEERGLDSLGTDKGATKTAASVPYTHYVKGWSKLLTRVNPDDKAESWEYKDEVDSEDAEKAFDECLAAKLSRGAVVEKVDALLGKVKEEKKTEAPVTPPLATEKPETEKPETPEKCNQPTLSDVAGDNAKDQADSIAELFNHSDAPDDLLYETLIALAKCKNLSRGSVRAIQGVILLLKVPEKVPAPITPALPIVAETAPAAVPEVFRAGVSVSAAVA